MPGALCPGDIRTLDKGEVYRKDFFLRLDTRSGRRRRVEVSPEIWLGTPSGGGEGRGRQGPEGREVDLGVRVKEPRTR